MGPWVAKQLDFYQKIHTLVWWFLPFDPSEKKQDVVVSHDSVYAQCSCLTTLGFVGLTNSSSSFSIVNGNVYCFSMFVLPIFPLKALSFEQPSHRHLQNLALEWSRSTPLKNVCRFSWIKTSAEFRGVCISTIVDLVKDNVKDNTNWIFPLQNPGGYPTG